MSPVPKASATDDLLHDCRATRQTMAFTSCSLLRRLEQARPAMNQQQALAHEQQLLTAAVELLSQPAIKPHRKRSKVEQEVEMALARTFDDALGLAK